VLVARRANLLETLAINLHNKYQTESKTIVCDLSSDDFMQVISAEVKSLDIGLLISNAGGGRMGAFSKTNADELRQMNHLNMTSHMTLSHYMIGQLLKQKRPGGLLLVSSMASLQGVPYGANYSAGKAYVLNLAESLNYELKQSNINVTALLPGPTSTPVYHENKDVDFNQMPMTPMSVASVVDEGLMTLSKNKPSHISGKLNRIMGSMGKRILSRNANINMWGQLMKKVTPKRLLV